MDTFSLPPAIAACCAGRSWQQDSTGLSGSSVHICDDAVLKIEPCTPQHEQSLAMLRWLQGRLPVPRILAHECREGMSYLVMSRVPGIMSCDSRLLEEPGRLLPLLAGGLELLWAADTEGCPRIRTLDGDLAAAREHVARGGGDMEALRALAGDRFPSPGALLDWLGEHRPAFDPVLCHGDYCLPNVLIDGDRLGGFVDLGAAAVADRYADLADLYDSLIRNFDGTYGGKVYPDFDPDRLFDHLCLPIDRDKLTYYRLLSTLFG